MFFPPEFQWHLLFLEIWVSGGLEPTHQSHSVPRDARIGTVPRQAPGYPESGPRIGTIPRGTPGYPESAGDSTDVMGDGGTEQILPAQVATGGDTGCWALVLDTCVPRAGAESIASRCWCLHDGH